MIKNKFETKEEAEEYRIKKELHNRVAVYLTCVKKWALVFSIKTVLEKETELNQ